MDVIEHNHVTDQIQSFVLLTITQACDDGFEVLLLGENIGPFNDRRSYEIDPAPFGKSVIAPHLTPLVFV
jgi:hypothetical protein